jgi:prepilin-type N-terminal cleavage/methylation domain-containing protein
MKAERIKGFTLIELLIVLAIVAMLIGLLMPALSEVRKYAGNVKQKAQINAIEIALSLYKNETVFGQYPPSHGYDPCSPATTSDPNRPDYYYTGGQTLAEAMFGLDLLGVEPNTIFRSDSKDIKGNPLYPNPATKTNLDKRKGPYLDRTNFGVFQPYQIFSNPTLLKGDGHMICDTFTATKLIGGKKYKIGTPILYYRANSSAPNTQLISYAIPPYEPHAQNIYNYSDNYELIHLGVTNGKAHKLIEPVGSVDGHLFYTFISDPMIPLSTPPPVTLGRPVNSDSYILISAGPDGIYGTKDDICNFAPNIQ